MKRALLGMGAVLALMGFVVAANAAVRPIPPNQFTPGCNPNGKAVQGDNSADTIRGTPRRDLLRGGGGADLITGRAQRDCVIGGDGRDTLKGNRGNDKVRGGAGKDEASGNKGSDHVTGAGGRDEGTEAMTDSRAATATTRSRGRLVTT
jgi:Ca2+-binding RTX toxin-like protein